MFNPCICCFYFVYPILFVFILVCVYLYICVCLPLRLFEEAMKSPLNQTDVPEAFEKYLKPILKSNL